MASVELVGIEVAYSALPGSVDRWSLDLPAGSCVRDALALSGLFAAHPELNLEALSVGVWGKVCSLDHLLRDHDRVEVYRPLKVDPKEARRLRHRGHRSMMGRR